MDREQEEMQFLGVTGICKESYKVIFSWRKIFSLITMTLILPLAFVFLLQIQVSQVLFSKIVHNEIELDETRPQTARYNKISELLSKELAVYLLFKVLCFIVLLVFSLLSTSAVVYTVAGVYTGREVVFRKVISVVPRVWRRLIKTFWAIFVAIFAYHVVAAVILVVSAFLMGDNSFSVVILILLGFTYVVGLMYMAIVWQLANVVSVLEEDYGNKAMIKSKNLMKGKMGVSIIIFFTLSISLYLIQLMFGRLVVHGPTTGTLLRFGYGALSFLLLSMLMLLRLVVHTVFYFVCKSNHHENIDKSALSDHLEVYHGDYVLLKSKDVQLEQHDV